MPRVQIFPTASSVPVSSMSGSNSPQAKPRTAMGAWRPERVCQEGKASSPLGQRHGRARQAMSCWWDGLAQQVSAGPPPLLSTPGSAHGFPSHVLPLVMLLSVAVGADDKSGLDLFCPHWDQRGLVQCRGCDIWQRCNAWQWPQSLHIRKPKPA